MNFDTVALVVLILAALPASLFLVNLLAYRRLPAIAFEDWDGAGAPRVSVLIPARNEEKNIGRTIKAVLANQGCEIEVIVLDDHSTDRTAAWTAELHKADGRVRLVSAPPLPEGWCGKQHACHLLASVARHPLLVFIDADVRLGPDALARMAHFMAHSRRGETNSNLALASGVPLEETGTLVERLLLPLIHFILLGFLPLSVMRRCRWPALSAGCGQLFVVRRDAYARCGGHAMIRDSLHDGVKLPRIFRRAGFATDLFDATDVATCRMYQTNADTWRGLGKNATEGLAAPKTIVPMSGLLLGGQVLPFVLLMCASKLSSTGILWAALAATIALLPRLLGVWKFRQSLLSAFFHPIGVLVLLAIQGHALGRRLLGRASEWKGRSYRPAPQIKPIKAT